MVKSSRIIFRKCVTQTDSDVLRQQTRISFIGRPRENHESVFGQFSSCTDCSNAISLILINFNLDDC